MDSTGNLTVDLLLPQATERSPDREAVVDLSTGERLTYRELNDHVNAVAMGLDAAGIEKGDRVAVCLKNRPEHVVAFLATQRLGAVTVPFNYRLAAEGIKYTLHDADADLFIYGPAVREIVQRIHDELAVETFIEVGPDSLPFATPYADLEAEGSTLPETDVRPADLSVIQYTSGTTGDPKGIPLDHTAAMTRVLLDSLGQRYYLEETMLGAMPLYHTVGLHGILLPMLAVSGTYLSMPDFDPTGGVEAIEQEAVTALHEAPAIFKRLLDTQVISETDVSSVRAIAFSGAPMSPTLMEAVFETFEPAFVSNQYGCTEAYAPLAQRYFSSSREPAPTGPANVLYRTRIVEFEAQDPSKAVESGQEGELIVNTDSPVAFDQYWQKPAETAASIVDGWFFTGDVAYRTDDGGVVITGRVDNMIISGGENIHPTELEDVLESFAEVSDAGVVGVDDGSWGQIPMAFVVGPEDLTAQALDEFFRSSDGIADFKRPRAYEFVDELPRNQSGKLLRDELRACAVTSDRD